MRWFISLLIVINLLILARGWLTRDEGAKAPIAAPGVGTIRLVGEPAAKEPAPVPIPAPPNKPAAAPAPAEPEAATTSALPAPAAPQAAPEPATPKPEPASTPAQVEATAHQPASEPPAQQVSSPPSPPPAKPRYCKRIGPFTDPGDSKALRSYLAKRGDVTVENATMETPIGYWVLVPPQPTHAAALAVATKLKSKGIRDLWVVPAGPAKNAISLGVFSHEENAVTIQKEIRAKGFDVDIRPKTRSTEVQWVHFKGDSFISTQQIRAESPAGIQVEDEDCP